MNVDEETESEVQLPSYLLCVYVFIYLLERAFIYFIEREHERAGDAEKERILRRLHAP